MNLSNYRSRICDALGLDSTDSTTTTKTDAWVNQAYQYVSGLYNWPWLVKQGTVVTSTDITTGTVSINASSTALTFSSAPSVSVANDWMIQFAASNDWYDISSHTAASTSATLASAYNESTNLSAGAYTLRRIYYSLPSDLDRIIDVRQMRSEVSLVPVDVRFLDAQVPNPNITGNPTHYALFGLDSNKYWRLITHPIANVKMNLLVRYYQKITELSSASDEPLIPLKWHSVLVFGALYLFGYDYLDDGRKKEVKETFEAMVEEMRMGMSPVPPKIATPLPWDRKLAARPFGATFPERIDA